MYNHRLWKTWDPVCSPIDKPEIACLVVGWGTTSESLVLYTYIFFFRTAFKFFITFQEI